MKTYYQIQYDEGPIMGGAYLRPNITYLNGTSWTDDCQAGYEIKRLERAELKKETRTRFNFRIKELNLKTQDGD